ncbi:MAG: hypothetical protein GEV10_15290 [Streptosporangiales bacterium]|nr:hypothetical protein [Streptosporangiales bacterium]
MNTSGDGTRPTLAWVEGTVARPELKRLWELMDEHVRDLAGSDYDVTFAVLPMQSGGVRSAAPSLANSVLGLSAAREAAVIGKADLVVFNGWTMPVRVTRALLDVSVTGVDEGSVFMGCVLSQRPAVVTVSKGFRWELESLLEEFGLRSRMATPPVWWLDPESTHDDVVRAVDDPDELVSRVDSVAQRAVAAGADAILLGCGYFGAVLARAGYTHVNGRPDVPVYDCTRLALEFGSTLYRLRKAGIGPSRLGFAQPSPASLAALEGMLTHLTETRGEGTGGVRNALVHTG